MQTERRRTSKHQADLTRFSFNQLVETLGITAEEKNSILGTSLVENLRNLKKSPREVREDQLERMELFLGICDLAGKGLTTDHHAKVWLWLSRPNEEPLFKADSPLNLLLVGRIDDLRATHAHLAMKMKLH